MRFGYDAEIEIAAQDEDLPGFTVSNARAAEAYLNATFPGTSHRK